MWPAVSKRLNPWPRKTLLKLRALFRKLTNGTLWKGHSFCKWTLGANSWALSPKKCYSPKQTFDTGARRFTEIMERFNHALAERLFGYQSGNRPLLGLKGFLKLFVLWIVKSWDWSERNLLKLLKKKRLRQNAPRPICALSEENGKKLSPNVYVCYLYQPDHNWSLKVYNVLPPFVKTNEPIRTFPSRVFVLTRSK